MGDSHWRTIAKPIIAEVIKKVGLEDRVALKKALREAYPFGPRAMHPYKIWLDEIKVQLGLKKSKVREAGKRVAVEPAEGQKELF